jgi:hypothetical protein
MTKLQALELPNFARQFRFAGGRIARIHQRCRKGGMDVDLVLRVVPAIKNLDDQPKPVRLRLSLAGVDELRIQKRPTSAPGRLPDAHFGYFQGQFFIALDAWSLVAGERPGVHDFRSADIYFACRDLSWEPIVRKPS